jgi:hypothetical protein
VIGFSQVFVTEGFDDDRRLGADEWIATTALNLRMSDPESSGLLSIGASDEVECGVVAASRIRQTRTPRPRSSVPHEWRS